MKLDSERQLAKRETESKARGPLLPSKFDWVRCQRQGLKKKSAERISNFGSGFFTGGLREIPSLRAKIQNPFALEGLVQTQSVWCQRANYDWRLTVHCLSREPLSWGECGTGGTCVSRQVWACTCVIPGDFCPVKAAQCAHSLIVPADWALNRQSLLPATPACLPACAIVFFCALFFPPFSPSPALWYYLELLRLCKTGSRVQTLTAVKCWRDWNKKWKVPAISMDFFQGRVSGTKWKLNILLNFTFLFSSSIMNLF